MSILRETTIGEYLDAVSSSDPTPGGGGVAAVAAALGAGLGSMVTAISATKSDDDRISELAAECGVLREALLGLSMEDQTVFDDVMSALRLPKDDPARAQGLESTVRAAAEVPLKVARTCLQLLTVLESLVTLASRHCISDIGAAAHLAHAAIKASLLNVYINITFMKDADAAAKLDAAAIQLESDGRVITQRVVDQVVACIRG